MDDLLHDLNIRCQREVPLGPLTWYRLGGPAKVVAHPSNVQQLSALAARCHEHHVAVYVLGSGANLLVADQGVDAVVVRLDDPFFSQITIDGNKVTAGAGADLMKLVLQTAKVGLGGLEVLAGIPATVGGAIRMNAGGAYGDIGQRVATVEVMDNAGHVYNRSRDDLLFSYRKTNITARYILSAEFELTPQDADELVQRVKEIFLYKGHSQPMGDNSTGCVFKNPDPDDLPVGVPTTAGELIDRAQLKNFRIGGAVVSSIHANFIIAHDGCTSADVLQVIEHVEQTVLAQFAVQLEREIVLWP